jgi:hypothetical protein
VGARRGHDADSDAPPADAEGVRGVTHGRNPRLFAPEARGASLRGRELAVLFVEHEQEPPVQGT